MKTRLIFSALFIALICVFIGSQEGKTSPPSPQSFVSVYLSGTGYSGANVIAVNNGTGTTYTLTEVSTGYYVNTSAPVNYYYTAYACNKEAVKDSTYGGSATGYGGANITMQHLAQCPTPPNP